VLAISGKNDPLEAGDVLYVDGQELTIAGTLKYNLFSSDGSLDEKITVITSDETFTRLNGISDYSLEMLQTAKDATDENVAAIRSATGSNYTFSDLRVQRTANTYTAFVLFVYAFLAIITLVTVLNIMNSISMSVSAKMKQYGAMRAVGMDEHQITKMIAAEAYTYAVFGCAVGCTVGLGISKLLYNDLITAHYSYAAWSIPVPLCDHSPVYCCRCFRCGLCSAKRIRNMAVKIQSTNVRVQYYENRENG
jgi:ABC-type antimicrobial peptide transport system permease subunit